MSTFHLYPHSKVIASSFTERFEDILRWLYKTDKANRDTCKHWGAWSREKFVEHLRLLYPQLLNAADKSYLEMIKEIPFQYDLDDPVVELNFQSELSKIVKYYDSLTTAEEAEAIKILLGIINIPTVFNWIPLSMRWPLAVMYQSRSPYLMIFDSCSWHISRMLDDLEPARYPIVGL